MGLKKGNGYFGELRMTDGSRNVMTEFSVGVEIDGKEVEIPTLTPNQSRKDIDAVLSGMEPSDTMIEKAVEHARQRISKGKSPFAGRGEQTHNLTDLTKH